MTSDRTPDRLIIAYVLSPLITVPILSAVGALSLLDRYSLQELVPGTVHISFFFALFGLPVAYVAEALLVLGVRLSGHSPATVASKSILALGTGAGFCIFGLLGLTSLADWFGTAATGALMGAGAGGMFVLIRGRTPSARSAS